MVRPLYSHKCGPGSIPRLNVICGLSLLVKERKGKERTLFKCLIFKRWSTNWGHCKLKLTNQRKSNQILVFVEGKTGVPEENPLSSE